jgi:hypothetical protein
MMITTLETGKGGNRSGLARDEGFSGGKTERVGQ